jgi:tRNA G18 (ribose-2'-O)-methylase SpoU
LEQLKHYEVPLKKPIAPVILICDAITNPVNAGAYHYDWQEQQHEC